MRKILLTSILMAILLLANCQKNKYKQDGLYAEIETGKGLIVASLALEKVPMTVANFVGLAEGTIQNSAKAKGELYFDGVTFHRVVPDFVIQAGDPKGDGSGGPGYIFPNEIHPDLKHDGPGILAMANRGPHTNGSQFYLTLKATPNLDGGYSVFGKVIQGMEVMNRIEQGDTIESVKIYRTGEAAKKFKPNTETFQKMVKAATEKIERELAEKLRLDTELVEQKWPNAQKKESGLRFIVKNEGRGEKPARETKVKVHYTVSFLDGRKLESSADKGQPLEFAVGMRQMIPGFDEAVLDMKKGEKRLLILPPHLAYGKQGRGSIPPNSFLIFEVELLDF
jgi:peptidylprolyl isomerase